MANVSAVVSSIRNIMRQDRRGISGEAQDREQLDSYTDQGYQLDNAVAQTQFFQVITMKGDALTYTAYTAIGEVYDRMVSVRVQKSCWREESSACYYLELTCFFSRMIRSRFY